MYSASDLRKGLKIELDGTPYTITDFNFMKPGKGQAVYRTKIKNLLTNTTIAKTFRSNDKIDKPALAEKKLAFSYMDGTDYVFMDDSYEQVSIDGDIIGEARNFLIEDIEVSVLFHNSVPIEVKLPKYVEVKIAETEPGARGNTATNVLKPAKIEGGYEINVPLFINEGDCVRVETETGDYMDRIRKS